MNGVSVYRLLVGAAALVVLAAGVQAARAIVAPLLFALFVTILCLPLLHTLRRRGVANGVAVIVILVALLVAFGLLSLFVGSSIVSFQTKIPEYDAHLQERLAAVLEWLRHHGATEATALGDLIDTGAVLRFIGSALGSFGNLLGNALLVLLAVAFLLAETGTGPAKLAATARAGGAAAARLESIVASINRYMGLKTAISALTGATAGLALWWIGVDYPLLWALVAFLLNFVPNIGSFLAAVPPVLLALVQPGLEPSSALLVAIVYTAINILYGSILEPRWMGSQLGLSTFVVFASLIVWGWLLGPIGMVLSVPLTITLKIVLEAFPETRAVAVWLDDHAPDSNESSSASAG